MDPKGWSTGRLFREHCSFINGVFVKDMSQIGRDMKDVIIIDNSPTSYMLQPECALPILSWYNDMNDRYLYQYINLLIEMSKLNDVRDAIPNFCRNNVIDMPLAMQVCQSIYQKFDNKRMPQYRENKPPAITSGSPAKQENPKKPEEDPLRKPSREGSADEDAVDDEKRGSKMATPSQSKNINQPSS